MSGGPRPAPRPIPPRVPPPAAGRGRWAEVEALSAAISRLDGRREAVLAREAELERKVSLAKGRLNARKAVETFLEEVQFEQNRRNVASFETLLTAFSQEILLGTSPIKLQLTTERNLPSLDIEVERAGGEREDVFEDNGGGLTNVIVAGLRLIAVVKSRSGRFVAFDEPDCWVKNDRVPAFFRVVEDASRRLGIQCFTITHHDVLRFGGDCHVSEIVGHPDTGVTVRPLTEAPAWPDPAAPGIRWVRLLNVQGYRDATLSLSPGVSALTGPNGHGKSTFSRAFRAMFFGEAREPLIRHGEASCTIEMGVAEGRVLRFTRKRKGNPVNMWSLHEADGSVVVEGKGDATIRYETGGRGVPAWVGAKFGIHPIEDLDVHIAHQKKPVFLLSEPPAKRASVLSIGQEADHVRRMIVIHRDRCRDDTKAVQDGEREIDDGRRLAARLAGAVELGATVEDLRERVGELDEAEANVVKADGILERLSRARAAYESARSRGAALDSLPARSALETLVAKAGRGRQAEEVERRLVGVLDAWARAEARAQVLDGLPEALPALRPADAMIPVGKAVATARASMSRAEALSEALRGLPASPPPQRDTRTPAAALARIESARTGGAAARRQLDATADLIEGLRGRAEALLEEAGGHCPACGQHVADPAMLVQGHVHR